MGNRDHEFPPKFLHLFPTGEEASMLLEHQIRRFRADDGVPVLSVRDLAGMEPGPEELMVLRTVYDRFSPGVSAGQ